MQSKAEVLARADKRLSAHIAEHGVDDEALVILAIYEASYEMAPEGESIIETQRCLHREGFGPACLLPLDHEGSHENGDD